MPSKHHELNRALVHAHTYQEWLELANAADQAEGLDEWREDDVSDHYDWRLIRSRLRQIRQMRAEGQGAKLRHHLRQGLHWNLGNLGNPMLYGMSRVGTKMLVHDYVNEVAETLVDLARNDDPDFPPEEKRRFFDELSQSFGRSALMLSGGATLGLFHVGVVKSLFLEGLLPDVISGSSAGSIVAATLASRPVDQAEILLDPMNVYHNFWRILPWRLWLRRGAVMDQQQLRHALEQNIPDLTFAEAHERSGRIIDITVSPAGLNQPPRLLNYLTFPYLYLYEAILASCAVPLLFPPVMLMTQDERGRRVPYMPLLRWVDGSLKSDLPTLRLRRLHNVNHFIVSQTNPHVLPFLSRREPGSEGLANSARDFARSSARGTAKGIVDLARKAIPGGGGTRKTLDVASSVLDQDYRGNINIFPEISLWRYANVTSNPSLESLERFIGEGERATWPRIEMIRNQTVISQTLANCVQHLNTQHAADARPKAPTTPKAAGRPSLKVVRSK
jgi:TAG lipase / steryl ester hydrolase / phospholipase A2 / LPA acyltransferase